MIKGLYSAVSAMIMNSNRQQVLSHNVANLDTPGFKQVMSTVEDYISTLAINPMAGLGDIPSELGSLGLGVQSGEDEIDFTQGGILTTENDYDLAIEGTAFFHVKTPEGDRYTRDGRFNLDEDGTLVTTEGYKVLDKNGQPITLEDGEIGVSSIGEIFIDGDSAAELDFVEFEDPNTNLVHDQGNYFLATSTPKEATNSSILQGALESSNVNTAQIMAQMIEVSRAYEAAQEMVQNQDELLGKTINSLGTIG